MPLIRAVDPISDIVSVDQADPDGLLVGIADLEGLGELRDSPRRVSENKSRVGRVSRFERGDLLVGATRSNESKVWLAERMGYCTTSLMVLRPNGQLDSRHLLWWLRARGAQRAEKRFEPNREWIELPADRRDLESIVLVLDQLDAVIKLRKSVLAKVRELGPAIFQERLGDPFGDRVWSTVPLQEAIETLEMGWSPRCADRPVRGEEWGVIKVSAVSSGRFLANENKALPQGAKPREELGLRAGDLLMVRSNSPALVGATAIVTEDYPRLMLTDKVWRLHVSKNQNPSFLKAVLSQPAVRRRFSQMATGSLGSMQNLTKAKVLDLSVVSPPRPVQTKYVADLALVDRFEQAQLEQVAQLEELLDALLGIAFSSPEPDALGEIVIQRALFDELSPLHQAIWRTLVSVDGALTMPELSRRLEKHMHARPGLDRLRCALDLLTAAGVATQFEEGHSYSWSEALPYDLVGSS